MMRRLHSLNKNRSGTAAIEFALTLPFLIVLTLGMFEIAGVISANMKLSTTSQLIADMVAQQTVMTNVLTTNFCNGGKMALAPLATTTFKADIVSVTHKAAGTSVDWQDTTCGGAATIPNGVSLATSVTPNVNDSVIIVVVTYQYTSPLAHVLSANYSLTRTSLSRPRNVPNITHT